MPSAVSSGSNAASLDACALASSPADDHGEQGQEERDGRQDRSRVEQAGEPCAAKEEGLLAVPTRPRTGPSSAPDAGQQVFRLITSGEHARDLLPVEEMMGTDNFLDAEELNKV